MGEIDCVLVVLQFKNVAQTFCIYAPAVGIHLRTSDW